MISSAGDYFTALKKLGLSSYTEISLSLIANPHCLSFSEKNTCIKIIMNAVNVTRSKGVA